MIKEFILALLFGITSCDNIIQIEGMESGWYMREEVDENGYV